MARPNLLHSLGHKYILHSLPLGYKFTILDNFSRVIGVLVLWIIIDDNQFNIFWLEQMDELLDMFSILGKYDLGLRVLGYVLAGLLIISCINSNRDASGEETSIKGKKPFRWIKPDDIDRCELLHIIGDQRFGELEGLLIVLLEIHSMLYSLRNTHTPFLFWDRALWSPFSDTTFLNSSTNVDGWIEEIP